jgi:hypothetical protein
MRHEHVNRREVASDRADAADGRGEHNDRREGGNDRMTLGAGRQGSERDHKEGQRSPVAQKSQADPEAAAKKRQASIEAVEKIRQAILVRRQAAGAVKKK